MVSARVEHQVNVSYSEKDKRTIKSEFEHSSLFVFSQIRCVHLQFKYEEELLRLCTASIYLTLTQWHDRDIFPSKLAVDSDVLPQGPTSL